MSRKRDTESIKSVIDQMISSSKLKTGMQRMSVKDAWGEVMGPGVLNYTTNVSLKAGTLEVRMSSSTLREELNYGKEKIAKMLNEHIGEELITRVILK
ncbi:DUF721 domain-containing protein [Flavobacteriaceae bacterium]|nr:DUF721 domain-containing protein [Flavobacteriaceae bacterium]